jgi:aryl sulfotransferase
MSNLPQIEHIYQNHHLDSRRWNWFTSRDDDIIIATSYKAGTTFMQTIVSNLLFPDGDPPGPPMIVSAWVDGRTYPLEDTLTQLEQQTHRRFIKAHLPLDGLRYFENVKYICVSRDPRDVFMSLMNHWGNFTPEMYKIFNETPGRVGEPFPQFVDDVKATWRTWITKGGFEWQNQGYPFWSHLDHALTFWKFRHLPNILMVHFNDLLADLDGEMRRIAEYLEISVTEELWPDVVKRSTFAEVKKDPKKIVGETVDISFKGGADAFIYKGDNGRWVGVLDDEDLALYEKAMAELPADYANWLQNGGVPA